MSDLVSTIAGRAARSSRPKSLQKRVPFGGAMRDRFNDDRAPKGSPCARQCYDATTTALQTTAADLRARLNEMQRSGAKSACFATHQSRFAATGDGVDEEDLHPKPDMTTMIQTNGKGVYTMRSRRCRFEWEKPPPKVVVSEIPEVILQQRRTKPPGENPFHRTIQGQLNGHRGMVNGKAYRTANNYSACAFKSKGACHPVHGFNLRQTLFATDRSSPVTWMGGGVLGPGEYEIDAALDCMDKQVQMDSMFKTKGCAGAPELDDDWRTSPNMHEDWTKRQTHWSKEKCRYVVQPFKDTIERFKPISPTPGPGVYKTPVDNITNDNHPVVSSPFLSTSPQISPFKSDSELECLDLDPKWEAVSGKSPLVDNTARASPSFLNTLQRPWKSQRWQGVVHPMMCGEQYIKDSKRKY